MANPGLGGLIQPQPGATTQGLPPASPQEQAGLAERWKAFFTNPAVSAGLAQFGTSMLANIGSRAPFAARVGLAGGDALRSVGGAAKFQADQQGEMARQQAEQERLAQGRTGLAQNEAEMRQRGTLSEKALTLDEKKLSQSATESAADRALKEKELLSNDSYRKMMLGLEREKVQTSILGLQTPRGRALQALQKNILDSMEMISDYDVDTAVKNGLKVIDQMFGPEGTSAVAPQASASGAPDAAPQGSGSASSPAAASGGGYTPDNPMPGALPFAQAAEYLRANPTPENIADFEVVYGPGSAAKAGVKGP